MNSRTLAAGSLSILICFAASGSAFGQPRPSGGPLPSPEGAGVYFLELKDGASLTTKTIIRFGLRGMGVAPAGSDRANSGHHHLLVDVPAPDLGQPIPKDEQHLHFGKGQTETTLTLAPGKHTLQLVLGDALHIPHDPAIVSKKITITVE